MTLTAPPNVAAVRSLFGPDGTTAPDPLWEAEPIARQQFLRALDRLPETEEFATGTHIRVWGRTLAGWNWMGWGPGIDEHVHVYRHHDWDQWALVPISTRWAMARGDRRGASQEMCFDAAGPDDRRAIVDAVTEEIRFGHGFEAVTTHLLARIHATGQRGDHPCNVHVTGRLRVFSSFARTPQEHAIAMLAALSLP